MLNVALRSSFRFLGYLTFGKNLGQNHIFSDGSPDNNPKIKYPENCETEQ